MENIIQILAQHKHLEHLMLIISNRCQRMTYSEIKDHLEKVTRTAVSDDIFLALFCVVPEKNLKISIMFASNLFRHLYIY